MAEKESIARLLDSYRGEIIAKSPKSLSIWQGNRTVMPGGVGSIFRLADPFPMVVKRARGARIWDADDNEHLDFMLGFSTMILGNTPDEVQEAIREALPGGTHYGQCHAHEYEFARLFCDMVPGVDKVSLCNSGSEATMYACRLARATTGGPLIAKFEGGYHGTHDLPAVWTGIRTALLRTGTMWGRDDGMAYGQLDQFRQGWGSIPGASLNWVPWIHIADEMGIILHLLERSDLHGSFNLSAPQPVQYRDYARFLGEIVGKPSDRHAPELMTRLFMGKIIADMVLHNRRMLPQHALDSGYRFKFPEVRGALVDLFPKITG